MVEHYQRKEHNCSSIPIVICYSRLAYDIRCSIKADIVEYNAAQKSPDQISHKEEWNLLDKSVPHPGEIGCYVICRAIRVS
jgi:hypothetical protein